MKLGISSEDLQDLILKRLDLMKNMSAGKPNPKLSNETPLRTNLGEDTTSMVPCFFVFFSSPSVLFSS